MFPFVCKAFVRGQAQEFEAYLHGLTFNLWRPRFIVVHNTAPPDLAMYAGWQDPKRKGGPVSDAQWGRNLEGFYKNTQRWNGGPHLAVTPKGWVVLNPLNARGTHTPSWNATSWGVETVGDFTHDKFDGDIRDALVEALAVLHLAAGLTPLPYQIGVRGLHFHKEDRASSHKTCPGKNMAKADLVKLITAKMAELTPGDHSPRPAHA